MDLLNLGSGAASGFVAAALTLLGWNRRLTKLEDCKQEISVCKKIHEDLILADAMARNELEMHRDKMQDDIAYIRSRVDKLIDLRLNGK